MESWKLGAAAGAAVLTALVVRRLGSSKVRYARRSVVVFVLLVLAFGAAHLAVVLGRPSWAPPLEVAVDLLLVFNVITVVSVLVFELLLPTLRLAPAAIVSDVITGGVVIASVFIVLRNAGVQLTGIVTTSAVVTGILALSLQATLGNVIGGVALQADRSVELGDWILLENGTKGVVTKIGWRHTVLENNDWDTLIVPNAVLLASTFTILGKRDGQRVPHRMWVYFNVDFRFSPNDVVRVIDAALQRTPIEGVASEPRPNCVCMNFAAVGRDSMGHYAARYWLTDLRVDDPTSSRVRARIFAALTRADIGLAVPAAHLWIEQDTKSRRRRKLERAHSRRRHALGALPFLHAVSEADLDVLAEDLDYVPFAAGELITQQGRVAHFLYIVTEGEVEVRIYAGDTFEKVDTVTGPGFVGEMGLMTGAPRAATVVAATDVECYRLDKSAFREVVERYPAMLEEISELLAQRAVGLSAAKEELDLELQKQRFAEEKRNLLSKIQGFFGLADP